MKPATPVGSVFHNTFHTAAGNMQAGTSFALSIEGLPPLLVTCQHLFGPAGGLSKDVPPSLMSRFVPRVSVRDALGGPVVTNAGAALEIPGVDWSEPAADLAAFPLDADSTARPLVCSHQTSPNQLYLAADLRDGAAPGEHVFGGVFAPHVDPRLGRIGFDEAIYIPGTSGAPVLDDEGALFGMLVRGGTDNGFSTGVLLLAAEIARMLRAIPDVVPARPSLFKRMFSRA